MNKNQRIAQVILNILIIAELCASVILAAREPDAMTILFFKYFFMMLIPTLFVGIFAIRMLGAKQMQPEMPPDATDKIKKEKKQKPAAPPRQAKTAPASHGKPARLIREQSALDRIARWKSFFQRMAAFCLLIVALSLLDSCQARFRTPLNVINVLPGATVEITGPLEKVVPIEKLTYKSSSNLIQLTISEVRTGIWFGGAMWLGRLKVNPDSPPGEYRLLVIPEGFTLEPEKQVPIVLVKVHQDNQSIRESSVSFIERFSGIPPWWLVVFCLPLMGLFLGSIFHLSGKMDHLLAQEGKAEIYRVSVRDEGYEISFGLGNKHGIKPGDSLTILNEEGCYAGSAVVQNTSEKNSVAIAEFDTEVRTGYIVSTNTY